MATTKAPRKKKEQIKRPDLKIGIKDFGPIAEGEIELKPLTVFIGPNNSGKSYAAMLVRSIFEAHAVRFSWYERFPLIFAEKILPMDDENLQKMISDLESKVDALKQGEILQIHNDTVEKLVKAGFRGIYENRLGKEITHSYSCKLKDLTSFGKKSFSVSIGFSSYKFHLEYQEGKLIIKEFPELHEKFDLEIKSDWQAENKEQKSAWIIADEYVMTGAGWTGKSFPYVFVNALSLAIPSRMLESVMMPCYYLPASRTGTILLYKGFSANVIKQLPLFGLDKQQEILNLSSIISDFISTMIEISDKEKGFYYQFAEELSMALLKGDIVLISEDKNLIPEIRYRFKGIDIPLHLASTSITELAPLILYLKYIVKPGSILIIEEPEAHLHPGNQLILAKYLVRLMRKGVNILITTHSDYLLEKINNFYLLGKLDPEDRAKRYPHYKDDYLNRDELGVYEFHYDEEAKGYKIKQSEIDEDGILEREIYNITEDLYEETSQLQREFDDEG
jgi:predicted ATPase